MESRGFIFSAPMAYLLEAGLVPVRKLGKLPAETITVEYALEYGSNTLEIHRDAIEPGQRVLIIDDLLATGGTVHGTIELVERLQGEVVGARLPRRARLPQGPRPAPGPPRRERHPVLSPTMAEGAQDDTALRRDLSTGPDSPIAVTPADLTAAAPPSAAESTPPEPDEVDLGRRRFFRQLASDVFQATATVVGAANVAPADLDPGGQRDPRPGVGRRRQRRSGHRRRTRADRAASGPRSGSTRTA